MATIGRYKKRVWNFDKKKINCGIRDKKRGIKHYKSRSER
jgi:hypothetical protein